VTTPTGKARALCDAPRALRAFDGPGSVRQRRRAWSKAGPGKGPAARDGAPLVLARQAPTLAPMPTPLPAAEPAPELATGSATGTAPGAAPGPTRSEPRHRRAVERADTPHRQRESALGR